jgi:hypothetical protein
MKVIEAICGMVAMFAALVFLHHIPYAKNIFSKNSKKIESLTLTVVVAVSPCLKIPLCALLVITILKTTDKKVIYDSAY